MTLILGVRCTDGIVLAADRKTIRGGETDYRDKIFELGNTLLAFEGLTGVCDDFLLLLRSEMDRIRGFTNIYEMKLVVEDIIGDLSNRYCERLGEAGSIGTLLGGLSNISTGRAELYYVHPQGYAESVRYRCSGHGADYAHSIAKFLLASTNSCQDNAFLSAFIISWVSEDVDMLVGGKPQVAIIKDNDASVVYLPDNLIQRAVQRARQLKPRLANAFGLTRYFTP